MQRNLASRALVASLLGVLSLLGPACASSPAAQPTEPPPPLQLTATNPSAPSTSENPTATTPVASSAQPVTNDASDRCGIRRVDFKRHAYPSSPFSESGFRFEHEQNTLAKVPKKADTLLIRFSHVEFGQLDGSAQPAALVYTTARMESNFGNAIDPFTVFAFRMSDQCQLQSLGMFEPHPGDMKVENGAFVVVKHPGREEWRPRGTKMERTLATNKDVVATSAPAWKARDLAKLAKSSFHALLERDRELLALFQATLGKSYDDFYWGMAQSSLSYGRGQLSGSGCKRVDCLERSLFTLSDQGELFAAVLSGPTLDRFGPPGKSAPADFEQRVQQAHGDVKASME